MLQFNKCINEMNDAHAYEMQVQMWKQTLGVLHIGGANAIQ
jgi:hypothetical protein